MRDAPTTRTPAAHRPAPRRSLTATAAAMMVGMAAIARATPAIAQAQVQPIAASVTDMSAGRATAIVAALLGLVGVVVGGLTLSRSRRQNQTGTGHRRGLLAMSAGAISIVLGLVVVATADGGLGTGNGLGGALVAVLIGVASTVLGGRVLFRYGRAS